MTLISDDCNAGTDSARGNSAKSMRQPHAQPEASAAHASLIASFGEIEHQLRRLRFQLLQLRHLVRQVEVITADIRDAAAGEAGGA